MDFNRNLLTGCGKTYLRAFLSWIVGMALSMKLPAKQPGAPVFKEGDEQIVMAKPVLLFDIESIVAKGPVIIYDWGDPEENNIFRRPTKYANRLFRSPLDTT